jgi:hypothetical protein
VTKKRSQALKGRKKRSKKLSFKKAAQALAKTMWKHLVQLPEEEREKDIAAIERALTKKLKQLSGRK